MDILGLEREEGEGESGSWGWVLGGELDAC
jgi:hypothetical protein